MQCLWGDRLPDHRVPPGAAYRHFDQQFCPLQRPVPDADCNYHHVFCRIRGAAFPVERPPSGRAHYTKCIFNSNNIKIAVQNRPQGDAILLCAGDAPLPPPPDRAGDYPLRFRPHLVCTGAGSGSGLAGRRDHLANGQPDLGWGEPSRPLCRVSGPLRPVNRAGWGDSHRLSAGLPSQ